jgi:hypothetical protein
MDGITYLEVYVCVVSDSLILLSLNNSCVVFARLMSCASHVPCNDSMFIQFTVGL